MTHDHKVSFRLDHGLFTQLMAFCKRTGSRPSAIIREALEAYFARHQ